MTLKFNPPKEVAKYAVFIEHHNGRGTFKSYDQVASAKNAVNYKSYYKHAKILENVGGEWYVLYDIDPKADHKPWQKEVMSRGWGSYKLWRGVPMTREEYGEWRAKVERERILGSETATKSFVPSNFEV